MVPRQPRERVDYTVNVQLFEYSLVNLEPSAPRNLNYVQLLGTRFDRFFDHLTQLDEGGIRLIRQLTQGIVYLCHNYVPSFA